MMKNTGLPGIDRLERDDTLEIVTAAETVREIERLPSAEKAEVLSALLRSQRNACSFERDREVSSQNRRI